MEIEASDKVVLNGIGSEEGKINVEPNHEESCDVEPSLLTLNATYQSRLRQNLNNVCEDAPDDLKLETLRSHVDHLEDLNTVLISTVLELQKEVQERVILMEKRLKSSAKTTMEAVLNLHDCEKEMSRILNEKHRMEHMLCEMESKYSSLTVENSLLRDQNFNYSHDIDALLHIIQNARSTGHWEMDSLTFCEVTPEQVFGPVQSLDNFCVPISDNFEPSTSVQSHNCNEKQGFIGPRKGSKDDAPAHSFLERRIPLSISHPTIASNSSRAVVPRASFKSDTIYQHQEELQSKSADSLDFPFKVEQGETPLGNSCELSSRVYYDSCLRRAYSEPHLFIFGQSIYVYKPCERPPQDLFSDDMKFQNSTCQSIDLKLPGEDMACKYVKTCKKDIFCNSKMLGDATATSLPCNIDRPSFSSCTSDSDFGPNYISNEEGNSGAYSGEHCCRCSQNTSPCGTLKEYHLQNQKTGLVRAISGCVQTDQIRSYSIGLQADFNIQKSVSNILNSVEAGDCEDIDELKVDIQLLRKTLLKTEDEVAGQLILIKELQTHLITLTEETETKEKEIKELNVQQKTLQDQKRSLLIQLDAQGDRVDVATSELENCRSKLQSCMTQIEQQSMIIKSLQDALVQSKRAFDETKKASNSYSNNKSKLENQYSQNSKNSILDL